MHSVRPEPTKLTLVDRRTTYEAIGDAQVCITWKETGLSVQMLKLFLLGVGTVLRLERDALSMVEWRRRATNEHASPPYDGLFTSMSACDG